MALSAYGVEVSEAHSREYHEIEGSFLDLVVILIGLAFLVRLRNDGPRQRLGDGR